MGRRKAQSSAACAGSATRGVARATAPGVTSARTQKHGRRSGEGAPLALSSSLSPSARSVTVCRTWTCQAYAFASGVRDARTQAHGIPQLADAGVGSTIARSRNAGSAPVPLVSVRAKQSKAKQSNAKQSNAKQSKAKQTPPTVQGVIILYYIILYYIILFYFI